MPNADFEREVMGLQWGCNFIVTEIHKESDRIKIKILASMGL